MKTQPHCTVRAPAKINLGLTVFAKRPDGFHDIESVLVALDLYDTLTFTRQDSGGVELSLVSAYAGIDRHDAFPVDDRNLIVRAVRAIERRRGITLDVRIELTKEIPVAAGLGGGSADAAATLVAVDHLYDLGMEPGELAELAGAIGSDVPFFLNGPVAVVTGRGERLHACSLYQDWWALLVSPPIHLSTAAVYSQLRLTSRKAKASFQPCGDEEGFFAALRQSRNDLEVIATRRAPELVQYLAQLREAGAEGAFVTGSGPTVVGVFRNAPGPSVRDAIQAQDDRIRVLSVQPVRTERALVFQEVGGSS